MTYQEFIETLFQHQAFTDGKFTLDSIRDALRCAGNPQNTFPCILVAGTNGKGTTASLITALLEARGVRTGLYTSPHLVEPRERFRIAGQRVTRSELMRVGLEAFARFGPESVPPFIRAHAPHHPTISLTLFEITTWMALCLFRDHNVDVAVLEVGLGGRLDATNAVSPVLSIITSIGLDHTAILGDTLSQIAEEKAGILRAHVPALLGPLPEKARDTIHARAKRLGTPVLDVDPIDSTLLPLWLQGSFASHAALALHAVSSLETHALISSPKDAHVHELEVVRSFRWPGRRDAVSLPHGPLRGPALLDGAHNPDGARSFVQWVDSLVAESDTLDEIPCGVIAMMADKDALQVAQILAQAPIRGWVVTRAPHRRSRDASSLAESLRASGLSVLEVFEEPRDALRFARDFAGERGFVAVCGSLFLIADVVRHSGVAESFWDLCVDSEAGS